MPLRSIFLFLQLSLSLFLHSHTAPLSRTQDLSLSTSVYAHKQSLSLSLSQKISLTIPLSSSICPYPYSLTHFLTRSHFQDLTHAHFLPLSLFSYTHSQYLSIALAHANSLFISQTHTHALSHRLLSRSAWRLACVFQATF